MGLPSSTEMLDLPFPKDGGRKGILVVIASSGTCELWLDSSLVVSSCVAAGAAGR